MMAKAHHDFSQVTKNQNPPTQKHILKIAVIRY